MKNIKLKAMLLTISLLAIILLGAASQIGYASSGLGPLGFTPTEPKETDPVVTEPPAPTEPPAQPTKTKDPVNPTSRPPRTPAPTVGPSVTQPTAAGPSVAPLPLLKVNGCTARARYMVKFVCGLRDKTMSGEPPVKPGNYATAINIHNFSDANACGMARPALAYQPGQKPFAPAKWQSLTLAPVSDLELDCNYLWSISGTKPGSFLMGMLDLGLDQTLPVAVVYTAAITDQMGLSNSGAGISIDVEYILPFWR